MSDKMTLRDQFAMNYEPPVIQPKDHVRADNDGVNTWITQDEHAKELLTKHAKLAYQYADIMMKVREGQD